MQNKKRDFDQKLKTLVEVFNIPLQENWEKFLDLNNEHSNVFFYFNCLSIVKNNFSWGNPETYKIDNNKYIERLFIKSESYFETKDLTGKSVVDVGCGWGILTLWYALSGAREVYAVGFPFQIEFIEKLINRAKEKKILDDSIVIKLIDTPLQKGNTTIGNLSGSSVDRVYYHDVFEHLPDDIFMDALIASFNILRKGGKLISVTANTDNPDILERTKGWWTKLENESHIKYRTNAIKEKIPGIPPDHLERMVQGTRGLLTEDFNKSIEDYKTTGTIIKPEKLMPAVDLTIDYICENYISPPVVIKMMEEAGFKSYCYAALMHSRRFVVFQPIAKVFKSLFMNLNTFSKTVVFVGLK